MKNELTTYVDEGTGYQIRQYTKGPEKNTKLYFTTENFTLDDQYFFFTKEAGEKKEELYRAHVESGDYELMADSSYAGFAMDWFENFGVMTKDNIVCRLDCDDKTITEIGALPKGGRITGHLTTSRDGTIVCSYKLESCIYALVVMDPATGKSEIVFRSDYTLGHTQVCPTDSDTIFFIHETGGDALQRMWMFDCKSGVARPYYVEQEGEWITHEVWTADGNNIVFMKLPHYVMTGSKDGHQFRPVACGEQLLHPGVSRDKKWFCADRISYWGNESPNQVYLINGETGAMKVLANTGTPMNGGHHLHPSFNRKGDKILFNRPVDGQNAQVCLIDLNQVERP